MSQHNSSNVINKVIYDGDTLIDLTSDTAVENKVLYGYTFHLADGTVGTGSCTYDADTSDATAQTSEILYSKTAYKNGSKLTGSMPNIGAQSIVIDDKDDSISISAGYHDGSGSAVLDSTEKAKLIAGNIKNGVSILGVTGNYTGSELIKATTGSGTPSGSSQTILPSGSGDYDYFTQFTIAAIPYSEAVNAAGGYTVTIG